MRAAVTDKCCQQGEDSQDNSTANSTSVTHMHEQELHLILSNPPPDALPRPKPECQGAKPQPFCSLAFLSAAAPPAGVKTLWILKHLCAPSQGVKTDVDHRLRGEFHPIEDRMGPRALKVLSMCLWSCVKQPSLQNLTRLTQPLLPVVTGRLEPIPAAIGREARSAWYERMTDGSLGCACRGGGVFPNLLDPPLPPPPRPLLFLDLAHSLRSFTPDTQLVSFLMGLLRDFFTLTTDSMMLSWTGGRTLDTHSFTSCGGYNSG